MMYCYCAYCFLKEHNGFSVKEFACNVRVTEEASLIPGLKRCTEEDTSVFILEKKLSDSLYYDSVDEVSTLLCNDRRGGQEGSCQRNLRT